MTGALFPDPEPPAADPFGVPAARNHWCWMGTEKLQSLSSCGTACAVSLRAMSSCASRRLLAT